MRIKANKRLGQNFLKNKQIVKKIINFADIKNNELILEIGPGTGALTKEILKFDVKIIAVEKDNVLAEKLSEEINNKNLTIVKSDIREYYQEFLKNQKQEFKLLANIPYYLSSYLIRMIFENQPKPSEVIIMVQKEWAERISLKNNKNNKLAMFANLFFDTKYLFTVKRSNFTPAPKVDSAVIKMSRKKDINFSKEFIEKFEKIINSSFRQPRKTLMSNLKNYYSKEINYEKIFMKLCIKNNLRPEELKTEQYYELIKLI